MFILTEVFLFVELVCTRGVDHAKDSLFYKLIHNVVTYEPVSPKYAVPFYAMFDELEYVDIIRNDYIHPTVVYDEATQCFVFVNMNGLFMGMKAILKKLHEEFPNDANLQDKYHQLTMFLSIVNDSMSMDELCASMNKL